MANEAVLWQNGRMFAQREKVNRMNDATEISHEQAEQDLEIEALAGKVLAERSEARVFNWQLGEYSEVLGLQETLREARREGRSPDVWLAGEHPLVITKGVRGEDSDIALPTGLGVPIHEIDRGGQVTLHNPGQLVLYPIALTQPGLLSQARLSSTLLRAMAAWVRDETGIECEIPRGRPGLFVGERKLMALGISIRKRVSMHGIAINLCNDINDWRYIVPCGEPSTRPITLSELTGRKITPAEWIEKLPGWLECYWGYEEISSVESRENLLS